MRPARQSAVHPAIRIEVVPWKPDSTRRKHHLGKLMLHAPDAPCSSAEIFAGHPKLRGTHSCCALRGFYLMSAVHQLSNAAGRWLRGPDEGFHRTVNLYCSVFYDYSPQRALEFAQSLSAIARAASFYPSRDLKEPIRPFFLPCNQLSSAEHTFRSWVRLPPWKAIAVVQAGAAWYRMLGEQRFHAWSRWKPAEWYEVRNPDSNGLRRSQPLSY